MAVMGIEVMASMREGEIGVLVQLGNATLPHASTIHVLVEAQLRCSIE